MAAGARAVSEVNGVWGTAIEVPGIAALNTDGTAGITSVSCASPGNCSAGGTQKTSSGDTRAFVVSQVHGTWDKAIQVPGTAALGTGGGAGVSAVSCGSPGNCAAAGSEGVNNGFDVGGGGQPFVVSEANGTWGRVRLVPGITALNTGDDGAVVSISCASARNCGAAGYYGIGKPGNRVYDLEAFVVSEMNGAWGRARNIPGLPLLNKGQSAGIGAVSCAAAGRCSAGGGYEDGSHQGRAFVTSQGSKAH